MIGAGRLVHSLLPLNESPSEKEGKCRGNTKSSKAPLALNESPSEKEGKYPTAEPCQG